MSGPRHTHHDHPFNSLVVNFIKNPSEENYKIILDEITQASKSEASIMFIILQTQKGVFSNAHLEQAELSHGALVGGVGCGALGASYQGLVQGVAPTTLVTGSFAAVGAAGGALYRFFSSEAQNSKNPVYPTFQKLGQLEAAAWKRENGFAISADAKSEDNASTIRRRPGGK